MDNLTHALVGLLAAETVIRVRERSPRPLSDFTRAALYVISIVGNNAPDSDFSYSRISGKTFGYLLHHRGYTHTVPAAFAFAAVLLGVTAWWANRRKIALDRADFWLLGAVACASPLLHIVMDYANNYGVHPFWPLYDGWFYGDSFFILEPSFWLVIIAPLAYSLRSRVIRAALWLVLAAAVAVLWYRPFVPLGIAVAGTGLTAGMLYAARRMRPSARLVLALSGFFLLVGAFVVDSRAAKALTVEHAKSLFPGATTLDVVATPMPANPFCWSVILLERDEDHYFVRLGRAATFPAWLGVDECPFDRGANPTAPLAPIDLRAGNRLRLTDEYRASANELRALDGGRCEAQALFRFARVPYLAPKATDGSRVIGDLRYDRHPDLDFADFRLPAQQGACPPYVPPWLPPRGDLLHRD